MEDPETSIPPGSTGDGAHTSAPYGMFEKRCVHSRNGRNRGNGQDASDLGLRLLHAISEEEIMV